MRLAGCADVGSTCTKVAVVHAWHGRTVEDDLGVRWDAAGVVAAADPTLVDPSLRAAAERLGADPALPAEPAVDLALA